MSRVMRMVGHHCSATVVMPVAAHALAGLQGRIGGGRVDGGPVWRRVGAGQVGGGGGATTAAPATGAVAVMGPGMMRTARERGMMRVGCGVARMVGVHTSG